MGKIIKNFWNTLESVDLISNLIFKNKVHYKLWDGTWDLTSLVLKKTLDNNFEKIWMVRSMFGMMSGWM